MCNSNLSFFISPSGLFCLIWALFNFAIKIRQKNAPYSDTRLQETGQHIVFTALTNVSLCHSWTFCSESRTFGSKTPVKHNNSQNICTRLQIEIKPPSEIRVPALTMQLTDGSKTSLAVHSLPSPVSDDLTVTTRCHAPQTGGEVSFAAVLLMSTRCCSSLTLTGVSSIKII